MQTFRTIKSLTQFLDGDPAEGHQAPKSGSLSHCGITLVRDFCQSDRFWTERGSRPRPAHWKEAAINRIGSRRLLSSLDA
jgi:hypothetical protein